MTESTTHPVFAALMPGLEFWQNMMSGAAPAPASNLPNLGSWVAPTLDAEEIDKRIRELKTVQYWLEQNVHAIKATVQTLEVQRMTLATLQRMNLGLQVMARACAPGAPAPAAGPPDLFAPSAAAPTPTAAAAAPEAPAPELERVDLFARAMTPGNATAATAAPASPGAEAAAEEATPAPPSDLARWPLGPGVSALGQRDSAAAAPPGDNAAAPTSATPPEQAAAPGDHAAPAQASAEPATASAPMADSLAWWGSLAQQFQHIAQSALKDAAAPKMPSFEDMVVRRAQPKGAAAAGKTGARAKAATPRKGAAAKPAARAGGKKPATGTGAKTSAKTSAKAAPKTDPKSGGAASGTRRAAARPARKPTPKA